MTLIAGCANASARVGQPSACCCAQTDGAVSSAVVPQAERSMGRRTAGVSPQDGHPVRPVRCRVSLRWLKRDDAWSESAEEALPPPPTPRITAGPNWAVIAACPLVGDGCQFLTVHFLGVISLRSGPARGREVREGALLGEIRQSDVPRPSRPSTPGLRPLAGPWVSGAA